MVIISGSEVKSNLQRKKMAPSLLQPMQQTSGSGSTVRAPSAPVAAEQAVARQIAAYSMIGTQISQQRLMNNAWVYNPQGGLAISALRSICSSASANTHAQMYLGLHRYHLGWFTRQLPVKTAKES